MIPLKNGAAQAGMRKAGALLAELFSLLPQIVRPGITTGTIDLFIAEYLQRVGMVSQTVGYCGYRHVSCISLNDEVVHGVPSERRLVRDGDMLTVDVCAAFEGYCADMARCFLVGEVPQVAVRLVAVAQQALDAGIAAARPGNRLGDISAAIQRVIESAGFGVVRDFAGHGIGKTMHEEPEILNYGRAGTGPEITEGMAFALEPMITEGSYQVYIDRDGWTAKTVDRRYAAHVEDTIIITAQGPEVVTRLTASWERA